MECKLCERPIQKYNTDFNQLRIGESHTVDICQQCIDKFMKWRKEVHARLFPTKTMKKLYRKDISGPD